MIIDYEYFLTEDISFDEDSIVVSFGFSGKKFDYMGILTEIMDNLTLYGVNNVIIKDSVPFTKDSRKMAFLMSSLETSGHRVRYIQSKSPQEIMDIYDYFNKENPDKSYVMNHWDGPSHMNTYTMIYTPPSIIDEGDEMMILPGRA